MKEVIFIRKYPTSRSGGSATVRLFSKEDFIKGNLDNSGGWWYSPRHDIQYCNIGGYSNPICGMTVDEFNSIFTNVEIEEMRNSGLLNYNTGAKRLENKYPMFRRDIYLKYGIDTKGEQQ